MQKTAFYFPFKNKFLTRYWIVLQNLNAQLKLKFVSVAE